MRDFTGKDPVSGAGADDSADNRYDFDLLVPGPAGQRSAIQATKLGKRVR